MNHLSNFYKEPKKRKIAICIFNRATYARCKHVIEELAKDPEFEISIGLSSSVLWKEFGDPARNYILREHSNVHCELIEIERHGSSQLEMARASAKILERFADWYALSGFDAVVVVADRYETLPAAMAASYQNIPLIHIQGGEITGNIDDKVRHAITKLSDYHFVSTKCAKEYVLAMGEEMQRVFLTGCPSLDLITRNRILRPKHPQRVKENYCIAIFHPETENLDSAKEQTQIVLEAVIEYCAKYGVHCYWHYPNVDPGREEMIEILDQAMIQHSDLLRKADNQEPEAFLRHLCQARLIVGNSSCGIRESSRLGVPSVNIGERQRLRERAENVIDADYDHKAIVDALVQSHLAWTYARCNAGSELYGGYDASKIIYQKLKSIDFSLKGPLTYPFQFKYRENHFGSSRFEKQQRRKTRPSQKLESTAS